MSQHLTSALRASFFALLAACAITGCDDGRGYTPGEDTGGTDMASAAGACKNCPTGMCCGATCVDLKKDAANCGACGKKCGSGETCVGGVCTCEGGPKCPADQVCCAKFGCKNTKTDNNHCGTCGNACETAHVGE